MQTYLVVYKWRAWVASRLSWTKSMNWTIHSIGGWNLSQQCANSFRIHVPLKMLLSLEIYLHLWILVGGPLFFSFKFKYIKRFAYAVYFSGYVCVYVKAYTAHSGSEMAGHSRNRSNYRGRGAEASDLRCVNTLSIQDLCTKLKYLRSCIHPARSAGMQVSLSGIPKSLETC